MYYLDPHLINDVIQTDKISEKNERNQFGEVSYSAWSGMELKVCREIVPAIICLDGSSNCRYGGKIYRFGTIKSVPRIDNKVDRGAWVPK